MSLTTIGIVTIVLIFLARSGVMTAIMQRWGKPTPEPTQTPAAEAYVPPPATLADLAREQMARRQLSEEEDRVIRQLLSQYQPKG